MNREEIFAGVTECVVESLMVEKETVKPETSLINDLNADSLDFLDIMFALETKFNIKLQKEDFNLLVQTGLKREEAVVDEKLTLKAKEILKLKLTSLPIEQDLRPAQLGGYITIETLVLIVESFLPRKK